MSKDLIQQRIEQFASELESLVRAAAIESVRTALGGSVPVAPQRSAAQPAMRAPTPPTPTGQATSKLAFRRRKGAKRTPAQLAQVDAAVLSWVKANPGKGVEHMAKALAVPSEDLKSRIATLIDGKKLRKTGVKRATKYFSV